MAITSLSMQEALLIAGAGFVVVLLMLSLLSLLVVVLSKASALIDARRKKDSPAAPPPAAPAVPAPVELVEVDELTAACVMAVVGEKLGVHPNELVFRRIQALKGSAST